MHAILHKPSPALARCELTHLERSFIDVDLALEQHARYSDALRDLGATIEVLNLNADCPDAVFVEDAAIVLDELAIVTSMGVASRRAELSAIAAQIARHRPTVPIELPAAIEGGDVLLVGRTLYIGLTSRTNRAGVEAVRCVVEQLGYSVVAVEVRDCLHLKTCVTALDDETLVINPRHLDVAPLRHFPWIEVDPREPFAANTLTLAGTVLASAASPRTADRIRARGYAVRDLELSELAKAEAGLTCMSLIFP